MSSATATAGLSATQLDTVTRCTQTSIIRNISLCRCQWTGWTLLCVVSCETLATLFRVCGVRLALFLIFLVVELKNKLRYCNFLKVLIDSLCWPAWQKWMACAWFNRPLSYTAAHRAVNEIYRTSEVYRILRFCTFVICIVGYHCSLMLNIAVALDMF